MIYLYIIIASIVLFLIMVFIHYIFQILIDNISEETESKPVERPTPKSVSSKIRSDIRSRRFVEAKNDEKNRGKAILKARRQGYLYACWHGSYYPTGLTVQNAR